MTTSHGGNTPTTHDPGRPPAVQRCRTWRTGSVCSGYGGLDLAATGLLDTVPAWFADNDPAAARVLAHHWPHVPNLGDLTTVDWTTVEPVEVLTGGTPCQDLSTAGRRAGMSRGTRSGIWHAMCDAIEHLRPRLVLWENVRGALSARADSAVEPCPGCLGNRDDRPVLRALGRVLGDLADLGYDAVWCCLPAAALGCAHLRWRVFLAATDPTRHGRNEGRPEPTGQRRGPHAAQRGPQAQVDWREYGPAIRRHEHLTERPAPAPIITGRGGKPKLSPWLTEWLMCLPEGHITNVPGLTTNDMLRLSGNGVVPLQALAAYRWLLPHLYSTPPADSTTRRAA